MWLMRLALVPIAGIADRVVTAEAAGRMTTGEAADSAEEGAEDIRLLTQYFFYTFTHFLGASVNGHSQIFIKVNKFTHALYHHIRDL